MDVMAGNEVWKERIDEKVWLVLNSFTFLLKKKINLNWLMRASICILSSAVERKMMIKEERNCSIQQEGIIISIERFNLNLHSSAMIFLNLCLIQHYSVHFLNSALFSSISSELSIIQLNFFWIQHYSAQFLLNSALFRSIFHVLMN